MTREDANRRIQKELNAGTASIVLLGLLQDRGRAMYGYEIAKQLESLAGGELPMNQGALYPVLRSLEKQELLRSEIQPSDSGPPRRYYRITKDGRRTLADWQAAWQRTKNFVDTVLGGSGDGRSKSRNRAACVASAKVSRIARD